jgi:predicted DNA-binding transcriptional regulator YafY
MSCARLSRCIRLLNLLQSRVSYSAVELAHELEVCKRTVYRDLHALEEAGIPVRFDEGRAGYVVEASFRLRALPLADDEAVALLLAAHTSSLVSNHHFGSLVRQASAKLLTLVPLPLREKASGVLKSLIVQSPAGLRSSDAEAACHQLIQVIRFPSLLRPTPPESAVQLTPPVKSQKRLPGDTQS